MVRSFAYRTFQPRQKEETDEELGAALAAAVAAADYALADALQKRLRQRKLQAGDRAAKVKFGEVPGYQLPG